MFSPQFEDFELNLVEFDGEKYHVHLLIKLLHLKSLISFSHSLKGVSSRLIRKKKYLSFLACYGDASGLLLILLQVVGVHYFYFKQYIAQRIVMTGKNYYIRPL
ncbi:transposase [Turicimonas muris]|uniref:transposase n=1 Tax=Turicimonas muris TaxID=1796652 RepID=UPI003F6790E5